MSHDAIVLLLALAVFLLGVSFELRPPANRFVRIVAAVIALVVAVVVAVD